jgi:hypothetical protein
VDYTIPKETTIPSSYGVLPVKITTHTHPAVPVPSMEYATVWNGRVYTWAPNYEEGNLLRPCGTDDNFDISLDYWPPDIAINPSSDSTEPILSVNPVQSHLFILTNRGNYRLYGNTPDNWECHASGNVGAYSHSVVAVVKGTVIWLGLSDNAKTIYSYSGSGEVVIGGPIEGLLQDQNYTNVKAYSLGNQYWLMFPSASATNVFVYDLDQKAWYFFEYPFFISAACMHGDYMAVPEIFFGTESAKIAKVSSSAIIGEDYQPKDGTETFETECIIGPFKMPDNRKFKAKTFWLTAEPENLFKVKVYCRIDGGKEMECGEVEYGERVSGGFSVDTQRIKLEGAEGHNVTLRLNSTGRIKYLQSGSITVEPREVK